MSFLPLILAAILLVVGGISINAGYLDRELPVSGRIASSQVGLYRAFMLATDQYVKANPTYTGQITWAMIKTANTTPDSMKNAPLDTTWKAVADGAGNFFICAQMGEAAVGALGQMMPSTAKPYRTVVNGHDYVWLGDPAQANANVAQCL